MGCHRQFRSGCSCACFVPDDGSGAHGTPAGWRQAFAFVLDRIKGADSDAAHTRALKWFLCLPAMLLRRGVGPGGGRRWATVLSCS